MVGQGHLARARAAAPAHQGHPRSSVMGGAKRPRAPAAGIKAVVTDGVHRGTLQRLLFGHGREDAWQAAGQHALAGAGGADHQQVVAAGGGDFQCPLGVVLAVNLTQIGAAALHVRRDGWAVPLQELAPVEMGTYVQQVARPVDTGAGDDGGLVGILYRDDEGATVALRGQGGGQGPLDGPQLAAQGQLPGELIVVQGLARNLAGGGQQPQGNGQVIA